VGSHDGKLYCLDGVAGRKEWEFKSGGQLISPPGGEAFTSSGGPVFSSPALGDLDGDGYLEVVFGCNNGLVYALDSSGKAGGKAGGGPPSLMRL
ncbi:MAG: hypothetical protein GWO44_03690, partial [Thermoplasmata archaeon]|nr:hypothetical protein [Thermoplasmata archaeon]NIY02395.1 hypothetical protein [Thermoplasmata archaeon]